MDKHKIPEGWRRIKLNEAATFERGIEPGSDGYNTKGLGLPFIRVSDLNGKKNRLFTEIDTDKTCSEEDILLALDGSPGMVVRGKKGIFSSGVRKVNSVNKAVLSDRFLFHLLQSSTIQRIIQRYTTGSTILHAGKSIDFMEVPIPSEVVEQNKIAHVLDTVDENIEETDRIIKESEQIKKGLMNQLFSKENKTKMHKVKFSNVLVQLKRGYSLATNSECKGVRYLTSGNLLNDEIYWGEEKYLDTDKPLDNCLLKKNDLLINCVNSYEKLGKVALFEGAPEKVVVGFNNFGLEFKELINPLYAKFYCMQDDFQTQIKRISKPAVQQVSFSGKDILKMDFYYPSKQEQDKIASVLLSINNRVKTEIKKQEGLHELKKSLMQKLLFGEIRVKVE